MTLSKLIILALIIFLVLIAFFVHWARSHNIFGGSEFEGPLFPEVVNEENGSWRSLKFEDTASSVSLQELQATLHLEEGRDHPNIEIVSEMEECELPISDEEEKPQIRSPSRRGRVIRKRVTFNVEGGTPV